MTSKSTLGLKAACFDLDGTLIDTGPPHVRAEEIALKSLGISELAPDHPVTFGAGILPGMQILADHYGLGSAEKVYEAYLPAWESALDEGLQAMPGADSALHLVHASGIPLVLVTSGEDEYVDKVMKQFDWTDLFIHRVTMESVNKLKPDPEAYMLAAEFVGLRPDQCAGFEDSSSGLRALDAAGMFSVFVREDAPETDLKADKKISSLEQLDEHLMRSLFQI